jgi:hypothetical protein
MNVANTKSCGYCFGAFFLFSVADHGDHFKSWSSTFDLSLLFEWSGDQTQEEEEDEEDDH